MAVAAKTPKILIEDVETGERLGAKSVAEAVVVLNAHISKHKLGKAVTKYGVNMAITRGDVVRERIKITRKGKASKQTKASSKVIPKGKRKLKIKKREPKKPDAIAVIAPMSSAEAKKVVPAPIAHSDVPAPRTFGHIRPPPAAAPAAAPAPPAPNVVPPEPPAAPAAPEPAAPEPAAPEPAAPEPAAAEEPAFVPEDNDQRATEAEEALRQQTLRLIQSFLNEIQQAENLIEQLHVVSSSDGAEYLRADEVAKDYLRKLVDKVRELDPLEDAFKGAFEGYFEFFANALSAPYTGDILSIERAYRLVSARDGARIVLLLQSPGGEFKKQQAIERYRREHAPPPPPEAPAVDEDVDMEGAEEPYQFRAEAGPQAQPAVAPGGRPGFQFRAREPPRGGYTGEQGRMARDALRREQQREDREETLRRFRAAPAPVPVAEDPVPPPAAAEEPPEEPFQFQAQEPSEEGPPTPLGEIDRTTAKQQSVEDVKTGLRGAQEERVKERIKRGQEQRREEFTARRRDRVDMDDRAAEARTASQEQRDAEERGDAPSRAQRKTNTIKQPQLLRGDVFERVFMQFPNLEEGLDNAIGTDHFEEGLSAEQMAEQITFENKAGIYDPLYQRKLDAVSNRDAIKSAVAERIRLRISQLERAAEEPGTDLDKAMEFYSGIASALILLYQEMGGGGELSGSGLLDSAYPTPEDLKKPYVTSSAGIDIEQKALLFDRQEHLQEKSDTMQEDLIPVFSRAKAYKNFRRNMEEKNPKRGMTMVSAPSLSSVRVDKHNVSGLPLPRMPKYLYEIDPKDPTKFVYREAAAPFRAGLYSSPKEMYSDSYTAYAEKKEQAEKATEGAKQDARRGGVEVPQEEPNIIPPDEDEEEEADVPDAAEPRGADREFQPGLDPEEQRERRARMQEEDRRAARAERVRRRRQEGEGFGDIMEGIAKAALISGMGELDDGQEGEGMVMIALKKSKGGSGIATRRHIHAAD